MTYEGKHRRDQDRGLGIGKVAGLAGVAATAAVLSVGLGAGTANADTGGILHNLFSPKKPSTSAPAANLNTKPKSIFGAPGKTSFGQIVVAPATGDGSYFSFNGTGPAVKGLCLNPKGC